MNKHTVKNGIHTHKYKASGNPGVFRIVHDELKQMGWNVDSHKEKHGTAYTYTHPKYPDSHIATKKLSTKELSITHKHKV
jgi:hypothetical protein